MRRGAETLFLGSYVNKIDGLELTVTARITEVSLDKEGRVILPKKLRSHASLDGEALFAGLGHSFQIWAPEEFRRVTEAEEKLTGEAKLSLRNPTPVGGV